MGVIQCPRTLYVMIKKTISHILAILFRFREALLENSTRRRENAETAPINAVAVNEAELRIQKFELSCSIPLELVPEMSMIIAAILVNWPIIRYGAVKSPLMPIQV